MENIDSNLISEYENKILFLENRLKIVLDTIEDVVRGNIEKAQKNISDYKEIRGNKLLQELIQSTLNIDHGPHESEKTYSFLNIVIEGMPFPVFIKDEGGKYLLVNTPEAELFGLQKEEIVGKNDCDFISDEKERSIIIKSDNEVLKENKSIELPNQNFSLTNGKSFVFKTHKLPFINPITGKNNILGFSIDVSDTVNLDKLKRILVMCSNPMM